MINAGELNLALQRGSQEKVAGWNDLSSSARSSLAGALGGSALGGLAWLLRPKDKDQNQWKEALLSILSGAALGGAVGYGYDKLPDMGITKGVKNVANDAKTQAKELVKQIRSGIKNMYGAKAKPNGQEAPATQEDPGSTMSDAEAKAEEAIIAKSMGQEDNGDTGNASKPDKPVHNHPFNSDQEKIKALEKFPGTFYNDYGFVDIDADRIDPGATKYPTNTILSWDMVNRFKDPAQVRAHEKALRMLRKIKGYENAKPIGWRWNYPRKGEMTIVTIDDNGQVGGKSIEL